MTQLLILAGNAAMRHKLVASVHGMDRPVVAVAAHDDAVAVLDAIERQVMIYAPSYGGDVHWVAKMLERHPGLRVVYLSPAPWVSLSYDRARCLIAPHTPEALDSNLLRRMVSEMLKVRPLPITC